MSFFKKSIFLDISTQQINNKILKNIIKHIEKNLDKKLISELTNKINCLNNFCKGDGCGLTSGILIDIFITKFLTQNLPNFKEYHNNETDCIICDEKLSLKKINGKSTIALNWSKNPIEYEKINFVENIMIINLKSCKWWKRKFPTENIEQINFTKIIPAGIYLVDKYYCQNTVVLSKNNKTNTLITSKYLYMMLNNCIKRNLYIPLPKQNKKYIFDILSSFVE